MLFSRFIFSLLAITVKTNNNMNYVGPKKEERLYIQVAQIVEHNSNVRMRFAKKFLPNGKRMSE